MPNSSNAQQLNSSNARWLNCYNIAVIVLHVDMDAFFASVEQHDHPEWRGKPVIVGSGPHERGVVSTCSYEARKWGVHSAMPSRTAYAHCPQGIFVRPRMDRYQEVSDRVFSIFNRYTPFVEGVSIDEAFLDITGSAHLFGGPRALAEKLRSDIRTECGVTCSAGLAPNRLLAKIASEEKKPDGFFETPSEPAAIRAWLAPKPASVLWGVGKKTGALLAENGYRTCGDLQTADRRFLERLLGEVYAETILAFANGEDDTPVDAGEAVEKSVSREYTFGEDETNREKAREALLELVRDVGRRVRTETRWARTAKLKFRTPDFETHTRQLRFDLAARDDIAFRRAALELFDAEWRPNTRRAVRLIGFGVTDFADVPEEAEDTLFGPDARNAARLKRERLADVIDTLGDAIR